MLKKLFPAFFTPTPHEEQQRMLLAQFSVTMKAEIFAITAKHQAECQQAILAYLRSVDVPNRNQ